MRKPLRLLLFFALTLAADGALAGPIYIDNASLVPPPEGAAAALPLSVADAAASVPGSAATKIPATGGEQDGLEFSVPEPASAVILIVGLTVVSVIRRRRRRRRAG